MRCTIAQPPVRGTRLPLAENLVSSTTNATADVPMTSAAKESQRQNAETFTPDVLSKYFNEKNEGAVDALLMKTQVEG